MRVSARATSSAWSITSRRVAVAGASGTRERPSTRDVMSLESSESNEPFGVGETDEETVNSLDE